MDSDKNPFLQMSQDQIQKIEAVLSSEQARALLMETSKQNVFCDSKIDDMLAHEDSSAHLDLNKFSGPLDVTLEDSLQDLEHLVLGHHDNPELFSEAAVVGIVSTEILHSDIRVTPGIDVIKLDHPYSLSNLSDQEESNTEVAEDDEPLEELCETEETGSELTVKSPPVRRSQRQLDKIEREKVEKIRAENAALQQREKEEMLKLKEESNDDVEPKLSVHDTVIENKCLGSPNKSKSEVPEGEVFSDHAAETDIVSESEKSEALDVKENKNKQPAKKVKSEVPETETQSKEKLNIKSGKETLSSPEKGTKGSLPETRKKIYRKEKSADMMGPAEPELFSTPDKIVKKRNDSVSESSDKTPEKKHVVAVLSDCDVTAGESILLSVDIGKEVKENNILEIAAASEAVSEEKKVQNHSVALKQQQPAIKRRESHHCLQQRSSKSAGDVSQVPQGDVAAVKKIEKPKPLSQKKILVQSKDKNTLCDVRKADSSSDNKKDSGEEEEEEFVDDPNDSDWASDDDPEKLWCICRKPSNNRFMIQCDTCKEWFHGTCVGITKQQGRQMEKDKKEWKCPPCLQTLKEENKKSSKQESSKHHIVKAERSNLLQNCIICKRQSPKDSIYCTPSCIEKHAKRILHLINQRKTKKELKEKVQQRIVVLDSRTGKLLTGPNAPTEDNLITWLKDNPTFQALKPGPSAVKENKTSPPVPVEKKHKPPVQDKGAKQTDIDLVRKNVIKTLTDILLTRCNSDNLSVASEQVKKIATGIEDELFKYFKDTGSKYKSKYRSLMFNVKDPRNQGLFRKIVKGKIPPDNLVRMSPEELASKELAKWRERETQHTLEMIKKEQLEKQNAPATYVKKTHKGEIEIEDGSSSVIEKEEAKPVKESAKEPAVDGKEMLADTTVEHRAHLFDLNCKICTGRMAPPEDEDLAAKKAKIAHTVSMQKELLNAVSPETEPTPPKKVHKSVKIIEKNVKKKKKKEDISDTEPSSTVCFGSPEQVKHNLKSGKNQSSVWKGFIFMMDVAKFVTNAFKVSGSTESLSMDLPDTVQVCGRIAPEEVWSYLSKIKQSGNKEIIIMQFQPTSEEEKTAYDDFYNYLNSRKRYGVVRNSSKMIKDFYIIPLPSRSPVPTVLIPFHGPGLDAVRANMLLGVIVRHKGKSRSSGVSQAQSTRTKIEKVEVLERSYTPPLESMPCQSTTIDSSNSPAYIPSTEKIAISRSPPPKRPHADDEPYEPSYTPPLEKFPRTEVDDDKPYDPEEVDNAPTTIITKSTPPLNTSSQNSEDGNFMTGSSDLESQKKLLAELTREVEAQKEQIERQKTMSSSQILPHQAVSESRSDTSNLPHTLQNILDTIKKKAQDLKESGKVAIITPDATSKETVSQKPATSLSTMSAKELLEKAERELAELEGVKNIPPPKPSVSWHISQYREPPPPGDEPPMRKEENPAYLGYSSSNPTGHPMPSVYVQPAVQYQSFSQLPPHQEIPHQGYQHPSSSFAYRQEAASSTSLDKNFIKNLDVHTPPPNWEQRDRQPNAGHQRGGNWQRWNNY